MEYNTLVHPAGRVLCARFRGRNRQFGDISTIIHNSTRTFHCQAVYTAFFPVERPFFAPFRGVLQTFYLRSCPIPLAERLEGGMSGILNYEFFLVILMSVLQVCHSFSQGFDLRAYRNLRRRGL